MGNQKEQTDRRDNTSIGSKGWNWNDYNWSSGNHWNQSWDSGIRAKMEISNPDDASEIQADAVADAILKGDAEAAQVELLFGDNEISAKASGVSVPVPEGFEEKMNGMKGSGIPLGEEKKSHLEDMMGKNLDHVRVHTGDAARTLSDSIAAQAFAHGDDVFIPDEKNEHLLAHEVVHTVQGQASQRKEVNRFESHEHKKIGDDATASQSITLAPGFAVTFGDMTALAGDWFGSVEEIKRLSANPGNWKTADTIDEVKYAVYVGIRGFNWKSLFGQEVIDAVEKRASELLKTNWSHFTNTREGDTKLTAGEKDKLNDPESVWLNNITAYRANHEKAVDCAFAAGRSTAGITMNEAWLYEGFASHFLTDGFSSGHIRTPRKAINDHWNKLVPMFTTNLEGWIIEYLVKNLWNNVGTKNQQYGVILWQAEEMIPKYSLGDLIGGAIHDHDNKEGVEARINGEWQVLYGDKQIIDEKTKQVKILGKTTYNLVEAALKLSVEDINNAYKQAQTNKKITVDEVKKSILKDGIYPAEKYWPVPESTQIASERKELDWKKKSFDDLFADDRMAKALTYYANNTIATEMGKIKAGMTGPKSIAVAGITEIENKMKGDQKIVQQTLTEIVDYTPGTVADTSGWFGAAGDDRSVEYFKKAKTLRAEKTLRLEQRKKLVRSCLDGPTVGTDDTTISEIITSTPENDIRPLFVSLNTSEETGWHWVFNDLSGTPLTNIINYAGPVYWKGATYDEKLDELIYLSEAWKYKYYIPRTEVGANSQLAIMTILRTSDPFEVVAFNVDCDFKTVLSSNYDAEVDELMKTR